MEGVWWALRMMGVGWVQYGRRGMGGSLGGGAGVGCRLEYRVVGVMVMTEKDVSVLGGGLSD